jgi:hypothetical protein
MLVVHQLLISWLPNTKWVTYEPVKPSTHATNAPKHVCDTLTPATSSCQGADRSHMQGTHRQLERWQSDAACTNPMMHPHTTASKPRHPRSQHTPCMCATHSRQRAALSRAAQVTHACGALTVGSLSAGCSMHEPQCDCSTTIYKVQMT